MADEDAGMDEQRLAAVFRAAAGTGPPPGFGHADVVAASRRATARRRSALVGGVLAVLAVGGVGVAAALPDSRGTTVTAAAPGAASEPAPEAASQRAEDGAAGAAGAAPGPTGDGSDRAGLPGDAASLAAPTAGAPLGPAPADGCVDPQDPALRAVVDEVLPEVAGAPEAMTTMVCEPGGGRAVHLEVADGATAGLLVVEYQPTGGPVRDVALAPGAATASAPTASGGTVRVIAAPAVLGGAAPFAARLGAVVDALGPRL